MASDISDKIMKEIAQYKIEYGQKWGMHFFDNFDNYLVGGMMRPVSDDEDVNAALEYFNATKHYDSDNSDKRNSLTNNQFYEEIDFVCRELGIDEKIIIKKRKRIFEQNDWSLFDMIVPLYIKLRERGYTQKDLWVPIVHS